MGTGWIEEGTARCCCGGWSRVSPSRGIDLAWLTNDLDAAASVVRSAGWVGRLEDHRACI